MSKDYNEMVGKTFMYNTREYTVTAVKFVEDDLWDVHTTAGGKPIRVNAADLKKNFLPVHTNENSHSLALVAAMKDNLPMKDLSTVLMETINKIKTDPKYVDQARAINETAKSLIELGKLQVEIVRTASGR